MDRGKSRLISISFLILLILCGSCTKYKDNPILYSPFGETPVVTGLIITGEDSPDAISIWGNPSGTNFCYPTIDDHITIRIDIGQNVRVRVWVVPARLPQQESIEIINLMNAHYDRLTGTGVATLLDEVKQAGSSWAIEYHFTDSQGTLLPEGFYRIYIQEGVRLRWNDVLNFRNESNYYKVLVNQIINQSTYIWRPQ